jgi:hypothetical protein
VLKIAFYEPWEKIGVKLSSKKYARTKKICLGNYCMEIVARVEGL